jgi:diguanylate cyclase (GGDEF)-like protein
VAEAEALLALTDRLSAATADLGALLATATEAVARLCGDTVALWLLEDGADPALRLASWWHQSPAARADMGRLGRDLLLRASARGLVWAVVERGPTLMRDVGPDDLDGVNPTYAEYFRRWGLSSLILVPLRVRGRLLGMLGTCRDGGSPLYDDADLSFVERIGAHVALAVDNAQLVAQVRRELAERVEIEDALRHQATHDALTGLPNRTALHAALHAALAAGPVAMLVMDLDGFKEVNDAFGHAVGDDVLVLAADRLVDAAPSGGVLARMGGDEFALVLPGAGAERAEQVARALRRSLAEPLTLAASRLAVSASIGVATAAGPQVDPGALLQRADTAMYRAKRAGLGVAVHDPGTDGWAAQQLPRLAELRRALGTGELLLHYQPVVDVAAGRVHHLEALVRWAHPERGLLGAEHVVPLAEQGGLAGELADVVLRLALDRLRRWRAAGRDVAVAVNVPAVVVGRPGFTAAVLDALGRNGLAPADLVVEVTESTVATRAARQGLAELDAAGLRLALDDFGTGWSSLAHLRDLPLRQVKVDRSFVTGLDGDPVAAALVRAVTALGHELGLQVVAEGVESAGESRRLAELGVDLQQGWLHGRPAPA